jgi:hypothetical protein
LASHFTYNNKNNEEKNIGTHIYINVKKIKYIKKARGSSSRSMTENIKYKCRS